MGGSGNALVDRIVAVEAAEGVKVEWLGSLVWSTITESTVTEADLQSAAAAAGIDPKYLPSQSHPKDAMRKAMRTAEVKRMPLGADRFLNLLAREVSSSKTALVYRIVRETVNAQNHVLSYDQPIEVTLDGDAVSWSRVPGEAVDTVDTDAAGRVVAAYSVARSTFDGHAVRNCVSAVLADCKPVAVRPSGGVYFVPLAFSTTVEALQKFIGLLADAGMRNGHRSVMRSVPVVDASEQRDMVRESLEDQVASESDSLLRDVRKALEGKVTTKVAEGFIGRVKALRELAASYGEVLRTKQTDLEATVDVLLAQTRELLAAAE